MSISLFRFYLNTDSCRALFSRNQINKFRLYLEPIPEDYDMEIAIFIQRWTA